MVTPISPICIYFYSQGRVHNKRTAFTLITPWDEHREILWDASSDRTTNPNGVWLANGPNLWGGTVWSYLTTTFIIIVMLFVISPYKINFTRTPLPSPTVGNNLKAARRHLFNGLSYTFGPDEVIDVERHKSPSFIEAFLSNFLPQWAQWTPPQIMKTTDGETFVDFFSCVFLTRHLPHWVAHFTLLLY